MGWEYVVLLVVSLVLSYALQPKPVIPPPAVMSDFDFPQAAEGTPQAVIFGDVWTSSWMVLSVGNYRTEPIPGEDSK